MQHHHAGGRHGSQRARERSVRDPRDSCRSACSADFRSASRRCRCSSAIATASRYGTGLRRSVAVTSATSGAITRHTVSFTKNADSTAADDGDRGQQRHGMMGMLEHPLARPGEESREPQIRDHDHHAEQQHDGVQVDRAVGLIQRQNVGSDHQARADDRRAGAVDAKTRACGPRRGRHRSRER